MLQVSMSMFSSASEQDQFEPEECNQIVEKAIDRIWLINDKKLANHLTFAQFIKYFKSQRGFEQIENPKTVTYRLIQLLQTEIEINEDTPNACPLDTELSWNNIIHKEKPVENKGKKSLKKIQSGGLNRESDPKKLSIKRIPSRDVDSFGKRS